MERLPVETDLGVFRPRSGRPALAQRPRCCGAHPRLHRCSVTLFRYSAGSCLGPGGSAYTPLALQELILPLAQRIRGGEYGIMRLFISTSNPGVGDYIRYMAQAHELPLYVSPSPNPWEGHPVGGLTETERGTLDRIVAFGGGVTASSLAAIDNIRPSAATNRLVNLDREGYLLRQPRGRREGDFYFEPRSATATPKVFEGPLLIRENTTGPNAVAW